MIKVSNLHKSYGATLALDNLDFEIGHGQILGLLGPNGAGKTTILRILTGFMPPDGGTVELSGRDLFAHGRELRRRTGYLPEHNPNYPDLSVRHNLEFQGGLYGLHGQVLRTACARVVAECGLTGMEQRAVRELSKGFRQRLGLAQALLHDPDIIFLDEPTSGLDPVNVKDLRELIRSFSGRKTVVLCTHVLSEVESTCDRVMILNRGRCVLEGDLAELSRRHQQGSALYGVRVSLPDGSEPAWSELTSVRSARRIDESPVCWQITMDDNPESPAQLAAWIQEQGGSLYELREQRTGLEDVFLEVIRGEERV
ncbi:MAG: ABC transporter ATP-binding protein [bacterium]|nr:ABC transporter ATP-binding protein [bacterium]